VLDAVGALRRLGHSVEYALRPQKLDKQQKSAPRPAPGARARPAGLAGGGRVHVAPARERVPRASTRCRSSRSSRRSPATPDSRSGPADAAA
jgi:hypothetical protein